MKTQKNAKRRRYSQKAATRNFEMPEKAPEPNEWYFRDRKELGESDDLHLACMIWEYCRTKPVEDFSRTILDQSSDPNSILDTLIVKRPRGTRFQDTKSNRGKESKKLSNDSTPKNSKTFSLTEAEDSEISKLWNDECHWAASTVIYSLKKLRIHCWDMYPLPFLRLADEDRKDIANCITKSPNLRFHDYNTHVASNIGKAYEEIVTLRDQLPSAPERFIVEIPKNRLTKKQVLDQFAAHLDQLAAKAPTLINPPLAKKYKRNTTVKSLLTALAVRRWQTRGFSDEDICSHTWRYCQTKKLGCPSIAHAHNMGDLARKAHAVIAHISFTLKRVRKL